VLSEQQFAESKHRVCEEAGRDKGLPASGRPIP
jgi:hypothetical protein